MIYLLFLIVSTDQWSPVNPQGKKAYGRNFLLELQNSPACQKKPHGLASLEIVRDKVRKGCLGIFVRLYVECKLILTFSTIIILRLGLYYEAQ